MFNEEQNIIEVTVITPNYNYGKYIEKCITSVIESDFDPAKLEIIVVDDASTDNSVAIINKIKDKSAVSINLIQQKSNNGLAKARNLGIKNARGKYLFFLDSDNYIGKECIKRHYEPLSKKKYSASYAPIQKFDDESGKFLNVFSNKPFDFDSLCFGNYIDAMSMIKKEALLEIGNYDEDMPVNGWEDYELWLRMGINNKKVHFINGEPLSYYRVHADSMINSISLPDQNKLAAYIKTKYDGDKFKNVSVNQLSQLPLSNYSDRIPLFGGVNHELTGEFFNVLNSLKDINIQLFWSDNIQAFQEGKSQHKFVKLNEQHQYLKFSIVSDERIKYLRFDIGNQIGAINIHDIVVRNEKDTIVWQWNINTILHRKNIIFIGNAGQWNNNIIQLAVTEDPQFIVGLNEVTNRECFFNIELTISAVDENQRKELTENAVSLLSLEGQEQVLTREHTLIEKLNTDKQVLLSEISNERALTSDLNKEKLALIDQIANLKSETTLCSKYIKTTDVLIQQLTQDKLALTSEIALKNETISENSSERKRLVL